MLDAGMDYAFQYCGDRHPGLGLHGFRDGKPKICAYSFLAWKRLLDAPNRVAATGSDQQGYNILAGKDAGGRHVRIRLKRGLRWMATDRGASAEHPPAR